MFVIIALPSISNFKALHQPETYRSKKNGHVTVFFDTLYRQRLNLLNHLSSKE